MVPDAALADVPAALRAPAGRRCPAEVGDSRRTDGASRVSECDSGQISHHPRTSDIMSRIGVEDQRRRERRDWRGPEPAAAAAGGDGAGGPRAALDVDRQQHRRQRRRLAAPAVAQANADGGGDTIVFSSLFNTPQTITLTSGQLELTDTADHHDHRAGGEPADGQRQRRQPGVRVDARVRRRCRA